MCAERERQLARARRAHPGTAHALRAHTRSRRPNSRKDSKGGQTRTWFVRLVLGSHGPNTIHMIDGYNPPRTELTEPQHPAEASNQPTPAARFCLCHPHTCNECPTVGEVIQAGSRQLSVDRRSTNARLLVKFAPADRTALTEDAGLVALPSPRDRPLTRAPADWSGLHTCRRRVTCQTQKYRIVKTCNVSSVRLSDVSSVCGLRTKLAISK